MPPETQAHSATDIEIEMAAGVITAVTTGTQRSDVAIGLDMTMKLGHKRIDDDPDQGGIEILGESEVG